MVKKHRVQVGVAVVPAGASVDGFPNPPVIADVPDVGTPKGNGVLVAMHDAPVEALGQVDPTGGGARRVGGPDVDVPDEDVGAPRRGGHVEVITGLVPKPRTEGVGQADRAPGITVVVRFRKPRVGGGDRRGKGVPGNDEAP